MRAPYQILALPYRKEGDSFQYAVFHRADHDQWQFISGGGEDDELPLEAARREIFEESGIRTEAVAPLRSLAYIPTFIYPKRYMENWPVDTYVVPEYSFFFECREEIRLSDEHCEYLWLSYEEAREKLMWDSNKTALYELKCILEDFRLR